MIVDQNHRGGVGSDGVAEAIRQADRGLGLAALVNEWRVNQPAATIEQHDPQLLLGQVEHLGTEIGCNVSRFAKGGLAAGGARRSVSQRLASAASSRPFSRRVRTSAGRVRRCGDALMRRAVEPRL